MEDKFDGNHYITAQVIITADDFAREMLGEDPTPQQIAEFIKDHASLMEIVYGTTKIADMHSVIWGDIPLQINYISQKVTAIEQDTDYLMRKSMLYNAEEQPRRAPWYKRIFGF